MEAAVGTLDGNRLSVVVELEAISEPSARAMAIGGAGMMCVASPGVTKWLPGQAVSSMATASSGGLELALCSMGRGSKSSEALLILLFNLTAALVPPS